jgi:hypothetical protein
VQRFTTHLIFYPMVAIFWLIMWTLLLRTELRPQGASLREVPIEHVARLIFREKQSSDLVFHGDGVRVGNLQMTPSVPSENRCVLDFSGTLQIRMPDATREHLRWNGSLTMDNAFAVQLLHLVFTTAPTQEASGIEITINPIEHLASYVWRTHGRLEDEDTFPLDESGILKLAEHLGIDPGLLHTVSLSHTGAAHITAHQSSLQVHNEKVDTYLVTVELNGQTMLEAQISQLGVVLEAKTALGWTLESQ